MAPFLILRSHVFAPAVALVLIGGVPASAQSRCEGTLCDFYYDHVATPSPPQTAPPQGQQPQQPKTAAQPAQPGEGGLLGHLFSGGGAPQPQTDGAPPARKPLVAVQGGGVIGLMQGRAPQRCTGTVCDLFYGGPPPEEPAAADPAAPPGSAAAARAADAAIDEPAATDRGVEPRESVRHCETHPGDPWGCYR